ncbi:MAG: glutamine--fructose-6-phosphate aminotransferase, partial [Firmicutes bacterium HGW-Firmicutes-21]
SCDCGSAFLFAVFAQMFACKLTAVKGRNPDAPRNLNKVTITK